MTILSLADKQAEINQEMIAHLEDTLALAREGKILDLVLGYNNTDNEFFTVSSYVRFIAAVGLAEMLKQDVVNSAED